MPITTPPIRARRGRHRGGYVLVMTLVLLVMAVLSLSGLARKSLRLALEANEMQRELQHRWGASSCRDLLLYGARERFEDLIKAHLDAGNPYPAPGRLRGEFVLGESRCRVWLTAEASRVNVNTLRRQLPGESRLLTTQLVGTVLPARLLPDLRPRAAQVGQWYTSPAQLFDLNQALLDSRIDSVLEASAAVTCWGEGKLDAQLASDPLLELVVTRVVSSEAARDLIAARRAATTLDLREIIEGLDLRRTQKSKLRRWLTDEAGCYSLWMEVRGPQRTWYHLWVDGHDTGDAPQNPLQWVW